MVNTLNTVKDGPGIFAQGMAETLRDNMHFCAFVDKADESDFGGKNGFKSGDTIYTSIPARYVPQQDNLDITSAISDTVEEKAALVLNKTESIGMQFDSLELATDTDVANALTRYGIPAAESIAQNIESRCFDIAMDATYNFVGTAGSNQFTVADILAARTKLQQSLCRPGNRSLFMNSSSGADAVDARKALFQSSTEIDKQYKEGMVGRADGFDWYESELVPAHTNGTDTAPGAVDSIGVEAAATLAVKSLANGATVTKGTVFTVAGVNKVHPITKADTGVLQQFVVTANATADGTGDATLAISPSLYAGSAGLQNITALPAVDAVVTFATGSASTTYTNNLACHKSAFKMVTVPLVQPKGVDLVATRTVDGITVNIVRDFDIRTREMITRVDVLYAFDPVRPEWACRITA
jgi:hypothetical protein